MHDMTNKVTRASALATTVAMVFAAGCGRIGGEDPLAANPQEQWQLVSKYCVDCHNRADFTAEIAFDQLGPESIASHPEVYEKVVRKLRGRLMPPPNQPQPSSAQLYSFVAWVEATIDQAAGTHRAAPAEPLHRLNRKEYKNAIHDLLALDIDPVEYLPQDDKLDGFDNIAAALQVSPSFVEQYVIAARLVALQAVGRPDARAGSKTYSSRPGTQHAHVPGLPLGTRGGVLAQHYFPSDGTYEVNIADMINGLWGNDMEFENTVVVTLDGKLVHEVAVGGEEDMKRFDQIHNGALDAINTRLKSIRFDATAGPHKVGVAFRHRTFAESDDRKQMYVPGGGQDRIFRVSSFQISGPFDPKGLSDTPSRRRIFTCHPALQSEQEQCAEDIVTRIGTQAFRRPLEEADVTELMGYYRAGNNAGGFEEGVRSALTGILASPSFLYRGEHIPATATPNEPYKISELELASKLSFFLWNTIPDDELRNLAARKELGKPDVLKAQVGRMLLDPRAATLASNFVYQWLKLDRLDEIEPDRAIFPYASGAGDLRGDFVEEIALFSKSLFDEDRSVLEFLEAKHTYVNERLALHYGIHSVKGDRFQRVELQDSVRYGLLGKGGILMAAAYPNRTSPVLRGHFILESILGTPPAAPPPEVPPLVENEANTTTFKTVRELMAAHSTDPTCFSCHGILDPLGFALENFDAVGAWRERDRFAGMQPLDTTGQLPDGTNIAGPDDLRNALLRRPDQFVQTFTERLLTYALGRTLEYSDMPEVRKIVRTAAEDDYKLSSIVWAVIQSDAFMTRQLPDAGPLETTAQVESTQ
jgi:mono/diheme cytochrome c family protein